MSTAVSTHKLPSAIAGKLRSVRWRHAAMVATHAMTIGWSVLLTLMLLSMAVDWASPFMSSAFRSVMLFGTLVATAITFIALAKEPIQDVLHWYRAAEAVDSDIPQLEERWSTVASLSSRDPATMPPMEKAMADQVTSEAIAMESMVQPKEVAPPVDLKPAVCAAVVASALTVLLYAIHPLQFAVSFQRFWNPASTVTATQLESVTGNQLVPRGEKLDLVTRLTGLARTSASLTIETASGVAHEVRVKPDKESTGQFIHPIRVDESLHYRVRSGDGQTDWHQLTVIDYPEIEEMRYIIDFPEYTSKPRVERDRMPRRVKVTQGSVLTLAFKPREKLESLILAIDRPRSKQSSESESSRELLERDDEGWYHFQTQLLEDIVIKPTLTSPHGLVNQRRLFSRIDVIADKAPIARVVNPTEDAAVALDDTIEIEFEAHDDHGIATAELVVYDESQKDADGKPKMVSRQSIPLDEQAMRKHIRGKTQLDLKKLGLPEGSEISYAIRVTDNRMVRPMSESADRSAGEPGDKEPGDKGPGENESGENESGAQKMDGDSKSESNKEGSPSDSPDKKRGDEDRTGQPNAGEEDSDLASEMMQLDDRRTPVAGEPNTETQGGTPDRSRSEQGDQAGNAKSDSPKTGESESERRRSMSQSEANARKENNTQSESGNQAASDNENQAASESEDESGNSSESEGEQSESSKTKGQSTSDADDENTPDGQRAEREGREMRAENENAVSGDDSAVDSKDDPDSQRSGQPSETPSKDQAFDEMRPNQANQGAANNANSQSSENRSSENRSSENQSAESSAKSNGGNQSNPSGNRQTNGNPRSADDPKADENRENRDDEPRENQEEEMQEPNERRDSAASTPSNGSRQSSAGNNPNAPPRDLKLRAQQSQSGQNTTTNRRRVKITARLTAIAKEEALPNEEMEARERVEAIDKMLAQIETALRKLVERKIADADRGEQFRQIDEGLGNVETFVADLREETKDNQFAFVGLQMVDIARTHVTPARDRVFAAIQRPNASDADAVASLKHIVRAREMLAALLKRYARVVREQKLKKQMDQTVEMYEVYVEKRRMLLREARQNLNPMERKMAVIEVDQEYLDRFAEVQKLRREMVEEFAKMLGDDPRLLSRYLELVKRRGKSMRDRLTDISQLQYDATEELAGWLQIDESQKQDYWTIIAELRMQTATDLAKDSAELAERIEKQMPLGLDLEVGTAAHMVALAKEIAGLARTIHFDVEQVITDAGIVTDARALTEHARALEARLHKLIATMNRFEIENEQEESALNFIEPRLLEARSVLGQADAWVILSQSLSQQAYHGIVRTEQQRLAVDTQLLRVEMLGMRDELNAEFQQLLGEPLPDEIVQMIEQLHQLMETITFNQAAAAFRAGSEKLEPASAQQQLATSRLVEAEQLFDKIRRMVADKLDEYDPPDPNIADLRDPTLDEFLARLEREPNIAAQIGIPNRRTNLRVLQDLVPPRGRGGLAGSGAAAAARAREAMKMMRSKNKTKDGDKEAGKKPGEMSEEEKERLAEAKKMREMLKKSLDKVRQQQNDPNQSDEQRQKLKKLADKIQQMMDESKKQNLSQQAWQQMTQADEAEALLDALENNESVPDQQWNRLLSRLEDGLWQVRGKRPPEAYRKAIEEYQDQIRELMQTIDEG